jgi:hypothetical protein
MYTGLYLCMPAATLDTTGLVSILKACYHSNITSLLHSVYRFQTQDRSIPQGYPQAQDLPFI